MFGDIYYMYNSYLDISIDVTAIVPCTIDIMPHVIASDYFFY